MPNKKPSERFNEKILAVLDKNLSDIHTLGALMDAFFNESKIILDELYERQEQQDKEIAELKKQPTIKFISEIKPNDSIRMHNNCTCCRPDAISSTLV